MDTATKTVNTESFFVVEDEETGGMEFWYDFSPFVDVSPFCSLRASRDQNALVIDFLNDGQSETLSRRFSDISEDIWECVSKSGVVLVVCGPSGILSRRTANLTP